MFVYFLEKIINFTSFRIFNFQGTLLYIKWAPFVFVYKIVVFGESCNICCGGSVSAGPRNSDDSSTDGIRYKYRTVNSNEWNIRGWGDGATYTRYDPNGEALSRYCTCFDRRSLSVLVEREVEEPHYCNKILKYNEPHEVYFIISKIKLRIRSIL